jgi:hypothetical protein
MVRWSVSGLGFCVAFGGELEDLRCGGDLRLGRLEDRIWFGRIPGGESLAEVVPVGVLAPDTSGLQAYGLARPGPLVPLRLAAITWC